jgi:hypothetical protein
VWEKVAPGEAVQGEADMNFRGIPTTRKNYLCIYHAKGECTRGSLCTWAHGNGEIGQVVVDHKQTGVKLDMCRHFLAGACWAGADCAWAHSETEQMAPMVYKKMHKITQWQGRFFWKDKTQWSGWQECDPPGGRQGKQKGQTDAQDAWREKGGGSNSRESNLSPAAKGEQKGKSDKGPERWICPTCGRHNQTGNTCYCFAEKGKSKGQTHGDALMGQERWQWQPRHVNEEAHVLEDGAAARCPGHAVDEEGPAQPPLPAPEEDEKSVEDEEKQEDYDYDYDYDEDEDEEGPAQPPLTAPEEDDEPEPEKSGDDAAPPPMGGEFVATGLIFDARGLLVEDEEDEHEDEHDEEKKDEEKQDEEKKDEDEEEKQDEYDNEDEDLWLETIEEHEYEDEEDEQPAEVEEQPYHPWWLEREEHEYEQPAEVEEQPCPEPELEQWPGEEVEAPYRIAQHRLIVMPPPPCQTCQGSPCWCTKNQRQLQ